MESALEPRSQSASQWTVKAALLSSVGRFEIKNSSSRLGRQFTKDIYRCSYYLSQAIFKSRCRQQELLQSVATPYWFSNKLEGGDAVIHSQYGGKENAAFRFAATNVLHLLH